MQPAPSALASAREQFLALIAEVRPELHRYCARLTGSVIEGEDIVQDTLAKAFYALSLAADPPPLRPWLFRIAHNAAIDHLRRHATRFTEARDDLDDREDVAALDAAADPAVVRAALSRFVALPIAWRSAVILKDVLGHSLEEVAATMGASVPAAKAALARGRAALRDASPPPATAAPTGDRAALERYARLFNAADWDGVRALIRHDCRLDLVAKSQRQGPAVGAYFARYQQEAVQLAIVALDGALALAAYPPGHTAPAYFIQLDFADGQVAAIRDFRYVPYIAAEAPAAE